MKLRIASLIMLSLTFLFATAQDQIKTNTGELSIQPIVHGTLVLEWKKVKIFVDPYGGAQGFANFGSPDIILITDIHGDHLNMGTLEGLDTENTILVVPKAVADQLPKEFGKRIAILGNGEHVDIMGISIDALAMYNLPETGDSRHPKGRGNGYVVTFADKRVYVSGDTEDIPEMRALNDIDVAFVCMNLPYTMDINQAASAVLEFKPKVVYPYHYRGQGGLSDVDMFKSIVTAGDKNIEVRLRSWYP